MKANLIKAAWVIGGVALGCALRGYLDGAKIKNAPST